MDGASKFVRGDAIAGLIIVAVNIIGGLVIGTAKGPPLGDAAGYTMLTIGDGLVSQVPALLTSVAAGIITTRITSETSLGTEVSGQLFASKLRCSLQPEPSLVGGGTWYANHAFAASLPSWHLVPLG